MAQPIANVKSARPVAFVQTNPNRISIGYEYYDANLLSQPSLISSNSLITNTNTDDFICVGGIYGTQVALGIGNNSANTLYCGNECVNPSDYEFAAQIIYSDTSEIGYTTGIGSGISLSTINTNTCSLITANENSTSYRSHGMVFKVPNSNYYLRAFSYGYYNRFYFNRCEIFDGNSIVTYNGNGNYYNSSVGGYLYIDSSNAYGYIGPNGSTYLYIFKYDIVNRTYTVLGTYTTDTQHASMPTGIYDVISTDTVKKFYAPRIKNGTLAFELYSLDVSTGTVSKVDCTVNVGSMLFSSPGKWDFGLKAWIARDTVNNRDLIFVRPVTNNTSYSSLNYYNIYVFEIDSTDPTILNFVTQYSMNSISRGAIYLNSEKTKFIVLTQSDAKIYNFDGTSIVEQSLNVGTITSALYDSHGRLWMISSNYNIYMLLPEMASQTTIKLSNPDVVYSGTPIPNSVLVSAYNFAGERISVTGTLKILTSNVTFDDGTTTKTITTSTLGDVEVPIVINGPGLIHIKFSIDYTA